MASLSLLPSEDVLAGWTTVKQALAWADLSGAAWQSIAEKLGDPNLDKLDHLAAIHPEDLRCAISEARLLRKMLAPLVRARASLVYNSARAKHSLELADVSASIPGESAAPRKRLSSNGDPPGPPKRRASDLVKLHVRGLGGAACELELPGNSLVTLVKQEACTKLGFDPSAARMVFRTASLKDSDRLNKVGIETGSELVVVIEDRIKVTRHVYNARGGAPPYRGSHLTASDTVSLVASLPLKDQINAVIPHDGMPAQFEREELPMRTHVTTLQKAWRLGVEEPAPRKWDVGTPDVDGGATAAQLFGGGDIDVGVLIPMRGCD